MHNEHHEQQQITAQRASASLIMQVYWAYVNPHTNTKPTNTELMAHKHIQNHMLG